MHYFVKRKTALCDLQVLANEAMVVSAREEAKNWVEIMKKVEMLLMQW
jgi:hypothetical protein